jgi:hypothetical protein
MLLCAGIFWSLFLFAEPRSFNAIFPECSPELRARVFSPAGFIESTEKVNAYQLIALPGLDPRIPAGILDSQPSVLVESLLVIPPGERPLTLLDVYNALGNIRDLKGRLYHSATRDENIPLFEDATRIAGMKKNSPIPDPAPAAIVPSSETMYLRIKDVNFGNSFYRGDLSLNRFGIVYRLSNYKSLNYLFVPIIKEEKFFAQIYVELVAEGVLVYSIAGAQVSDFVASKIHMPSAISKRLGVIISWVVDGINEKSVNAKS